MLDTTIKAIYSCARTILVYGDNQGKGETGVHHQRTFSLHLDSQIDQKVADLHSADSDEEDDFEKDVLQIDITVEDMNNNKSYFNNNNNSNKPVSGMYNGDDVNKDPVEEKQQESEAAMVSHVHKVCIKQKIEEEKEEEEEDEEPFIVHGDIRRPGQNFVLTLPSIEEITRKHANSARMRPRSRSMPSNSPIPSSPSRAIPTCGKSCPAHTQPARVAEKNRYVSVDRGHTFIMPKRFTFDREALLLSYITPAIYSKAKWPEMQNHRHQDNSSSSSYRTTSTFQVLSTLRSPQYVMME